MANNVWEALARELRQLKREAEGIADQLSTVNEKIADISARITEAQKGTINVPPKETGPGPGSVSDY